MLTYKIDKNNVLTIYKNDVLTDVYTNWDSESGAKEWAEMICAKYNENPELPYPPIEVIPDAETV